jgi:CO/xanthine dehydrogenase Mo-binding subunit
LFVDNIFLKGMHFVRTIRSPVRSGKLLSIDCPVLPEGYRLIRVGDIPGQKCLPGPNADFDHASHPILAESRLLYEGQPVALLTGPEPQELVKLEAAILVNAEEAEMPEWVYAERNIVVETDAKSRSHHVVHVPKTDDEEPLPEQTCLVETCHRTPDAEHNAPECNGAVASFEGGRCFIHTASQWPRHVRRSVAGVLNIDEAGIVIGRESSGVHFDAKLWYPSLIAVQAALAAYIVKKPVKFMLTREEERRYSPRRATSEIHIRSKAAVESGRILETHIAITADLGACGFFADEIIDRMALASLGLYRLGTVNIQARAVGSASVPKGAFSGFGMAQGFFAIERHLAHVTDELRVSPLHWKLERNVAKREGAPMKLPIGIAVKKPLAVHTLINTISAQSDFGRKWAAYDLQRRREKPVVDDKVSSMRGIGLALAYQGAGLLYHTGGDPLPSVTASVEDDELVIKCASSKEAASYITLWKNIARNAAGPAKAIKSVRYDDSGSGWGDDPAVLSRDSAYIAGLVEEAVRRHQSRVSPLPESSDMPEHMSEARYQSEDVQNWAGKICDQKAFAHPSLCAAVIEVEIDRVEYKPLIRNIRLCVEGGKILSVSNARNTLIISCIAALAWAQGKREVPNIKDVHPIEINFIPVNNEQTTGNESITGLEELAFSTVPAAYAAAVSQALGISFDSLPIRPLEIWQALHQKTGDEVKGGEE